MPFIYSPRYETSFGQHIFPVEKYRLVREALRSLGIAESDFFEPETATEPALSRVHSADYLDDLRICRWTARTRDSELPLNREIVDHFLLAAGGTLQAVTRAEKQKWCVHIGGGFHHAFADRAEGFCYLNDLAVAAADFLHRHVRRQVLIVDLDLHQGNGTARIFRDEPRVFTFSMHQADIYPRKEASSLDVPLRAGTGDETYLTLLSRALERIKAVFRPDLLIYQAGADPYERDQLGNLHLSIAGLKQRDEMVCEFARYLGIPAVATLGGGYAERVEEVVQIHVNTCLAFLEILGRQKG